jgi:hypothetical protein
LICENRSDGVTDSVTLAFGTIAESNKSLGTVTKEKGVFLFDSHKNLWINTTINKIIIENNPGPLIFLKDQVFVQTQMSIVFTCVNLGEKLIRIIINYIEILVIDYTLSNKLKKYEKEYGNSTIQVNDLTEFNGGFYIGTNQRVITSSHHRKEYKQVLANRNFHNISSDENMIYAMTYNELLSFSDNGLTWKNIQNGPSAELYTFNVYKNGNFIFSGQWQ